MAHERPLAAPPARIAAGLPYALVGVLIAIRNPAPLVRAEFWAEDALVFFPEALNAGWHALYTPVYGYQFLLSRLIAWTAAVFPVVAAPFIYGWVSLLVNAVAIGYFARGTFAWIVPSQPLRVLACVLLVLAPGGGEVMMNLCNLMTPLTLLALLLLIESPGHLTWPRFGSLLFLSVSAGPVLMLTPLVAFLAWRTRNPRYLALIACMLPIFIANVVGNHLTGSQNGLLNYSYAVLIPMALADNFALRLVVLPVAGIGLSSFVMTGSAVVYWSVAVTGAFVMLALWWRGRLTAATRLVDDDATMLLLLGFACAVLTFAGIAVSRSYAILQILRQSGDPLWQMRYAYLPGAMAVLVWVLLLSRLLRLGGLYAVLGCALLATIAVHEFGQWGNVPARRDAHWPQAAAAIQDAVDARRRGTLQHPVPVSVPVHPANWRDGVIHFEIEPAGEAR